MIKATTSISTLNCFTDVFVFLVIPFIHWDIFESPAQMLLLFLTCKTLSDLFTNVTDDTILKFLKVINLYTKISKDNIRSKYMVLSYFYFYLCIYI